MKTKKDTSTLSDKIIWDKNSGFGQGNIVLDTLDVKDVKEFVKRLLDWAEHFKGKDIPWNWVIGKIKFEAGKDLK